MNKKYNTNQNYNLYLNHKDKAEIGIFTGAAICAIYGISALLVDSGGMMYANIKNKYYDWRLKKVYKKAMKNPKINDEVKEMLKEKIGPYVESL